MGYIISYCYYQYLNRMTLIRLYCFVLKKSYYFCQTFYLILIYYFKKKVFNGPTNDQTIDHPNLRLFVFYVAKARLALQPRETK